MKIAELEQKLREIDEYGRLSCLWPLNLICAAADK